jgi:hypothetical protein
MRQDPLQKIIFPEETARSYEEEEEIRWIVEGLKESLQNKSFYFHKVTFGSSYIGLLFGLESLAAKERDKRQH